MCVYTHVRICTYICEVRNYNGLIFYCRCTLIEINIFIGYNLYESVSVCMCINVCVFVRVSVCAGLEMNKGIASPNANVFQAKYEL